MSYIDNIWSTDTLLDKQTSKLLHACSCRLTSHRAICGYFIHKQLKALLMGVCFIYIKLGILSLCTEPWHGTLIISISWDFCLYWKAIWWIDYVYRYWLWIHTHLSTTINITVNGSFILTHVRGSDQYSRAFSHELLRQL